MPAPKKKTGTASPRTVAESTGWVTKNQPLGPFAYGPFVPGPKKPPKGVRGGSSQPTSKGPKGPKKGKGSKGGGKKGGIRGSSNYNYSMTALNPDFDPRMRSIGSPLNNARRMRRGWIQSLDNRRVNFLFNPSELSLTHNQGEGTVTTAQELTVDDGTLSPSYASTGSGTSVKLLYDRTYEMFSPPSDGPRGFANRYGVWADVAAWYVLLGMLPEMPTSWEDSLIVDPAQPTPAYLFIGPKMVYHGWVTSIGVTYTHWSQNMVPVRCAVDVAFEILPFRDAEAPLRGRVANDETVGGWGKDWVQPNVPDFMP